MKIRKVDISIILVIFIATIALGIHLSKPYLTKAKKYRADLESYKGEDGKYRFPEPEIYIGKNKYKSEELIRRTRNSRRMSEAKYQRLINENSTKGGVHIIFGFMAGVIVTIIVMMVKYADSSNSKWMLPTVVLMGLLPYWIFVSEKLQENKQSIGAGILQLMLYAYTIIYIIVIMMSFVIQIKNNIENDRSNKSL